MEVIPLTLALSLLLSLTFIVLFVREFSRPRRAGADRDSLLPLEHDLLPSSPMSSSAYAPRPAASPAEVHPDHGHDHHHGHTPGDVCASKRTDGKCCSTCQRRKDRAATRPAPAAAQPPST